MNCKELKEKINHGEFDLLISNLYGQENINPQRQRYVSALSEFEKTFGDCDNIEIFSVPGRSELSGNHTDHNRGCVIASSVSIDVIAVACKTDDTTVTVKSDGFGTYVTDISKYTSPDENMFGTSESIIAGVCCGLSSNGYVTGGFSAYVSSCVPGGSGLSSSAAFENMIGTIINHMYNSGKIDNVEIAKISRYAENVFFGKPCGLMDQVACAVGGIVAIDFKDPSTPVIEPINFDMSEHGYNLCIVNTGGNHADLTEDYSSVPSEMHSVSRQFSMQYLRDVGEEDVIANVTSLREKVGDRAILRALHFFEENKRVEKQKEALASGDVKTFFENVKKSGISSYCYLQNVYTTKNVKEQGLSLALCLSEMTLADKDAAWRVHGGGFAGTIQAFVRREDTEAYRQVMDACFGTGACLVLKTRPLGAIRFA